MIIISCTYSYVGALAIEWEIPEHLSSPFVINTFHKPVPHISVYVDVQVNSIDRWKISGFKISRLMVYSET